MLYNASIGIRGVLVGKSMLGRKYRFHLSRMAVLAVLSFFAITALNYLDTATAKTVSSYHLEEFSVGQVADRSIFANRSMSASQESGGQTVTEGEKIISKGFPITEEQYAKLKTLSESPLYFDVRAFANRQLFLVLILALSALLLNLERVNFANGILAASSFCITYLAAAFGHKSPSLSGIILVAVVPSTLFVLLEAIIYGERPAIFIAVILSLGVLLASEWQADVSIFTLLTGAAASLMVRRIERRMDMVIVSIVMALLQSSVVVILQVVLNETMNLRAISLAGANGFLSGIFALGFLTPLELVMNTASVFRLMDLSDLNAPTMRSLMVKASGTYAHSVMVAQLAEGACRQIGARALIARVGAYYHDIGKMDISEYFVENQSGQNKHDEIKASLSATVIKSHVKRGVDLGRKLHLPDPVVSIIAEHHGNSVIAYFYNEAKKADSSVSEDDFKYPGPAPSTKESAVVMLADTVEAACRTLDNPTAARLDKFIDSLFKSKTDQGQLEYSPITYSDIAKIKISFVQLLTAYYHNRVKYPNQKDPDADKNGSKNNRDGKQEAVLGEKTLDGVKNA